MSEYLQKIIYLTKDQYNILVGGGTVGSLTGYNNNYLYCTTDENITTNDLGDLIVPVSKGGTGKTSFTIGSLLVGNSDNALTEIAATNSNTPNTVVKRDASGNFSAGTITASLNGNANSASGANTLIMKSVDNTTLHNTSGTFAFSGSGAPWSGYDWVGLQVGSSNDKFQIVGTIDNNSLLFRTNDNGGTNTSWGNWQMVAHSVRGTQVGNSTQPVYITSDGVVTAGTALKALAYKDSLVSDDIPDNSANTTGNAETSTSANYLYPFSDGTNVSGTTNIQILQTVQNNDATPRSVPFGVKLQHGNTEVGFGYFYPKNQLYGGWYIASYGSPSYITVNNGTWSTCQILTSKNTSTSTDNAATLTWGTTYTIAKINNTDIKFTTMAKPTYEFADLTSHPTTLSDYGITDAWSKPSSITSGRAIISSGTAGETTLRGIRNNTTKGELGWTSSATDITLITTNTLAYWNGAYSGTSSNLAYYKDGAFGSMAKEKADDYAKLASPTLTGTPTAPTAENGTSTTQIATTEFVNNTLSYINAMRFKGTLGTGGTITALPASHEAGDTYRVITAGTWAGKYCEVGTLIICTTDGTAANDAHWTSVETNEDGAVIGPESSTNNAIARFDGATGRIIQNSGITIDDNGNLIIAHAASATMTATSTNPQIIFSDRGNQPVYLIYTDQDSYRSPAGLKIIGGTSASPAWLEVEGDIYAAAFKGNADTATQLTTARNLGVALDSTTAVTFDGSADQTSIPVSGTLGITHGGTGQTTLTAARQQFSGPEFIVGTWTAASGTWTGTTTDSELYDGKQIILYMPFAGSGNATLNLTLADGTTTGAKNVYFESTTRFTTHKGQNAQLHLIYHSGLKLSNGTTYEGWWYVANRDTDNDYRTRQNVLANTDTSNRSLLLANPTVGTANNNTAYVTYRNDKIYANVNTGIITATGFNGDLTGDVTGNADTATAANITSTTNAVAYYTNTTGTFGSKASADGALYATAANGALQWGTLPIGQGGTGKTSWTQWGIVYADTTSSLAQIEAGANGNSGLALISNGAAAPEWYGGLSLTGTAAGNYVASFNGSKAATSTSTAAVVIAGGIATGGDSYMSKTVHFVGAASDNPIMTRGISGANSGGQRGANPTASDQGLYLNVNGGPVIVGKNDGTATNQLQVAYTYDASSKDTGAFIVSGGAGIGKKLYVGTSVHVGNIDAYDTNVLGSFISPGVISSCVTEAGNGYYLIGGSAQYGRWFIETIGKANNGTIQGAQGKAVLEVGNSTSFTPDTPTGGAQNSCGIIRIHGTNTYHTDILAQANGNSSCYLPNYDNDMYLVHAGNNEPIGSDIKPVYVARNGRVTVCNTKVGDPYTPIYAKNGEFTATSPVQYFTWSISSGKYGVSITDSGEIFKANTYSITLVVLTGESNLNAPLTWTSGDGTFSISTAVAVSGDVTGYAIVARGTNITNSSSLTFTQINSNT